MPPFIQKSLVIKTILVLLALAGVNIAAILILEKQTAGTVTLRALLLTALIPSIITLFFVIVEILIPLKKVTSEMKALLIGKKYHHIFTKNIDEIGIMAYFFTQLTESLEPVLDELKERKRMSAELDIARKIQRDLLPKTTPVIPGLSILAKTRPAVEIGGDAFDFIQAKGENTVFYIGDVSGHGVPSGLGMMMVNTLVQTFCDMFDNSYDIVNNTNKYLTPLIQRNMMMTMVMFRWHIPEKQLFYVGAGHEHIIHIKKETGEIQIKRSGGIALGMLPDISSMIKEEPLDFDPGDVMILYTDGISESKNPLGQMLTLKGIKELIRDVNIQDSSEEIFNFMTGRIGEFIQNTPQADDMTLMVIKNTSTQ